MNEAIQEIAVKHGVVLSKDDPILILQTMNERLIKENRKAHQEILAEFREEIESISSQWQVDAKEKAEKIINASLFSSKKAMTQSSKETINESIDHINSEISKSVTTVLNKIRQFQRFNWNLLFTSIIFFVASILIFKVYC